MPVQGGFDICRDLRADRRFARTPIIFLTCSKSDEDFRGHLRAGGSRFLHKTICRRRLVAAIEEELAAAHGAR
jgi:CheY-like chemotaxis protein